MRILRKAQICSHEYVWTVFKGRWEAQSDDPVQHFCNHFNLIKDLFQIKKPCEENMAKVSKFSVLEICSGAGGQALGLEYAGFSLVAASEIDEHCCNTLKHNRPKWNVLLGDVRYLEALSFKGIDLLAGGVPCPPFSIAGKQLGHEDERDLFPEALRLIEITSPKAVMLENVRGFGDKKFQDYRRNLYNRLHKLKYFVSARILNAADYGVPQLRPRFIIVGLKEEFAPYFRWPDPFEKQLTVSEAIGDLMLSKGWKGGNSWLKKASKIAPTIVGGSKKHGGPDLGPTRAKKQWAEMGVNGHGIANDIPDESDPADYLPKLTLRMVARIQGFPDEWEFLGGKTASYRQIGNAFPPAVAKAVGLSIFNALIKKNKNISDLFPFNEMNIFQ